MASLKTQMSEVIVPAIAGLHGRVVKAMGDRFIAEFGSVVDAVRSAAAIQPRLTAWNAEAAPDKRLELRIGVNLGDVVSSWATASTSLRTSGSRPRNTS
ncbi:MAG TPA: hypothetical protein VFE60_14650 [Roseiarcus sp.]|jgi:class 3 adenylate cyclase|nr:hypothetical protein [Roseiarcus sp.]